MKMKIICSIAFGFTLLLVGCEKPEDSAVTGDPLEKHRDAVERFQDGQERFKELVGTIRSAEDFDQARTKLDQIVTDWHDLAKTLREYEPVSDHERAEFQDMIAAGHRRTEPTTEDMMSLISIETREDEISKWLEEFAAAAGEAGTELGRLYGPTDYSGPEAEDIELDLSSATIEGVPLDQALNDPTFLIPRNKNAEQGSAGQPATRSESDSEGGDKPQPESEGRSR